jgi:hypothetical protein
LAHIEKHITKEIILYDIIMQVAFHYMSLSLHLSKHADHTTQRANPKNTQTTPHKEQILI